MESHQPDNTESAPRRHLLAAGLFLSLFSYGMGAIAMAPLLDVMAQSLSVSAGEMGLLFPFLATGYLLVVFPAGPWADRIGLKPPALMGAALMGAGQVGLALAPAYFVAALAMFTFGTGAALCRVTTNATGAVLFPRARTTVLNLLNGVFGFGAVVASRLGGALVDEGISWRVVFVILAAVSFLPAALYAPVAFPSSEGSENDALPPARRSGADIWRSPMTWTLAVVIFFYVGAEATLTLFGVVFLEKVHGWGKHAAASAVSNLWLAITLGRFATGALARRFSPEALLTLAAVGSVLSTAAFLLWADGVWSLNLTFFIAGLCFSGTMPTASGIGTDLFPERAGTISSILMGAAGAALLVLVPLGGVLVDAFGVVRALPVTLGYLVLVVVTALWVGARARAQLSGAAGEGARIG